MIEIKCSFIITIYETLCISLFMCVYYIVSCSAAFSVLGNCYNYRVCVSVCDRDVCTPV